jgi:hypothetical protein
MPPEQLETNGPFVKLNKSAWVRHSAIVIVRSRNTNNPEGSGSEVVVRANATSGSGAGYTVWTDAAADQIIDACKTAATFGQ